MIQFFYNKKLTSSNIAEKANSKYNNLISHNTFLMECKSYNYSKKGLDAFFHEWIGNKPDYKELWSIVKYVLIMSHGNATVE